MATVQAEGTQAATLGTSHTLATVTDAGTYLLHVDTSALGNGETLTCEIHSRVLSTGVTQLAYPAVFDDAQAAPNKISVPVMLAAGRELVFKLKQEGGVGRSFPWEVLKA